MTTNTPYTVNSAADRLGIHPSTVRRAIASGDLHATRYGARMLLIDPADLDAWGASRNMRYDVAEAIVTVLEGNLTKLEQSTARRPSFAASRVDVDGYALADSRVDGYALALADVRDVLGNASAGGAPAVRLCNSCELVYGHDGPCGPSFTPRGKP